MLMRVEDMSHRELFESEDCFRAIVEQSVAAVFVVLDGKIVYANSHMRHMFGYEPDEPIMIDPHAYVKADDWPRVTDEMKGLMSIGDQAAYSTAAVRKDGAEFVIRVHATLASCNGKALIVAVAKDITDTIRADAESRQYIDALKRSMESTIQVVSMIGETRDPYTHGHERRVGELAAAIAEEMGLDAKHVEGIRVAGYLHDIGKIATPAELLSKPTRLSAPEFELIKEHARKGFDILKGVDFPWPVALVALQHHERIDGSGYPQGLKGDQIVLDARIMCVADVVEAMSSHRPYRPGLGMDRALAEIERGAGTAYDPAAVSACLSLVRERHFEIPA